MNYEINIYKTKKCTQLKVNLKTHNLSITCIHLFINV